MDHLRRLGTKISISIPADENCFTGRECPQPDCEGYFKIELGTGLKGEGLPCHCPYCGHAAGHDQFWTKEQIEYATSVAMRKITAAIHKDLKKLEFDHKPEGAFGIGISMKVEPGRQPPIHYYRRCCMIQLRREWGRFSNFSFRTPQRRISAYPARPSG